MNRVSVVRFACTLVVDGLSVSVDGPAKAEVQCHDNKDGTCAVTWIPPTPGEYKIHIRFAGKAINGSPFIVRIAGTLYE